MRFSTIEKVSVLCQIKCDRCGKEAARDETAFDEMTSIGFDAGYGSFRRWKQSRDRFVRILPKRAYYCQKSHPIRCK